MVGSESPINKQIEHFVESSVWTTAGSGTWDETQSAKSPQASARNGQGAGSAEFIIGGTMTGK